MAGQGYQQMDFQEFFDRLQRGGEALGQLDPDDEALDDWLPVPVLRVAHSPPLPSPPVAHCCGPTPMVSAAARCSRHDLNRVLQRAQTGELVEGGVLGNLPGPPPCLYSYRACGLHISA